MCPMYEDQMRVSISSTISVFTKIGISFASIPVFSNCCFLAFMRSSNRFLSLIAEAISSRAVSEIDMPFGARISTSPALYIPGSKAFPVDSFRCEKNASPLTLNPSVIGTSTTSSAGRLPL